MLQLATTSQGFALDNSEAMLAYARKLASDMGAAVEFQHGDMQMYKLQVNATLPQPIVDKLPCIDASASKYLWCIVNIA